MNALLLLAAACPLSAPAPDQPGQPAVVRTPAPAAISLNNEGKALYRQERWEAARDRYRAAQSADAEFLAPALNIACSLAREERFAEAAREAAALAERGFVPWGREVLEAADLATLHVRPEMQGLRAALARAAGRWGASVLPGLLVVARTKPPIRLQGEGVLVLGLNQEIFAWLPRTGRFRQVTADDGRVLAFTRSSDRRTVIYVRAGKLVRKGASPPLLRGLSLRRLDVASMTLDAPVPLPDDIATLELWPAPAGAAELRVVGPAGQRLFRFNGQALQPAPALSPVALTSVPVKLTGRGVDAPARAAGPPDCRFEARDVASRPPRVEVRAGRAKPFSLDASLGAGLFGLPFPSAETETKPAK
jgi:hypothetical protein